MTREQIIELGVPEDMADKVAQASQTELKSYIPKSRFDEVNEAKKQAEKDIKARDTQLESLKKDAGTSEELKKQIEQLQTENKTKDEQYQKDLNDLKLSNAIKLSITGKAQDEDLVAGLIDKSKLILGEDGKITGLEEQMKSLQESKAFLFKSEDNNQQPGFVVGADGTGGETAGADDALAAAFGNNTK